MSSPIADQKTSSTVEQNMSSSTTGQNTPSPSPVDETSSVYMDEKSRHGLLHLVRHGEANHNIDEANRSELDPLLTDRGEEQARALNITFPYSQDRTIKVFSSPLRRTIQTALIGFSHLLPADTGRLTCLPEAQEVGADPCDTGMAIGSLATYLLDAKVSSYINLERVVEGWDSKEGEWAEGPAAVEVRARKLLNFLKGETESCDVVLVTHGWFIHYLIRDWDEFYFRGHSCGFNNCEFRSYEMIEGEEGEVRLEETERSKALRNPLPLAPAPASPIAERSENDAE